MTTTIIIIIIIIQNCTCLSVSVVSAKVLIEDTIFTPRSRDRIAILRSHPSHAKV